MSDMDERIPIRGIARKVGDLFKRMTYRPWLAFDGNVTVADDPTFVDPISGKVVGKTTVTVGEGGEGGGTPSDTTPVAVDASAAAAGVATAYARGDHKHALGDGAVSTAAKIASNVVTTAKIADANVTLSKIANIATARFLGRTTASSGPVEELTAAQATAMLDEATTSLKGLLSSAFWQLLDGATAAATASRLMRRDANADVAVRRLTVTDQINATGALSIQSAADAAIGIGNVAGSGNLNLGLAYAGGFASTTNVYGYNSIFNATGAAIVISALTQIVSTGLLRLDGSRIAIGTYGGASRMALDYVTDQAQTSTSETTPTGFAVTPSATRPTHYLVRLAQRIGDDEAVHVFDFWARSIGGVARFTSGAPPAGVTATTPAVAAFQAAMEESGGGTIRARTQRDTSSSVNETFEVFEVC
jgi:hypothetical protein